MPAHATAYLVLIAAPSAAGLLLQGNASPAPRVGQIFPLVPGKNLLGRDCGATIFLPWLHVSRRHAVIEFFTPGSWEIEDLQSRNGTFVNGTRLLAQSLAVLNEGDRICVGTPGPDALELVFTLQPAPQGTRQEQYERFLELDDFGNDTCSD